MQNAQKKGYNVIVSGIAPNKNGEKNKKIINFFEIYLNCSFSENPNVTNLKQKSLLSKNQNIIGLNHPYEKA